ncbi:hypothetical protein, partial [Bifidobacterium adolescentis]|uniref:hypothetical protein n=1 Tax=Bifidobacterium adolescentis TaxID=1680 RepID=UPI001E58E1AA
MAISFRRNLAQFPTNTISAGCDSSRSSAIAQSSVATRSERRKSKKRQICASASTLITYTLRRSCLLCARVM